MMYLMELTCIILLIQALLCHAVEPALRQFSQQLALFSNTVPKHKGKLTIFEPWQGLPTRSDVQPRKIDDPHSIVPTLDEREDAIVNQIWGIKKSKDFKEVLNEKINQTFGVSNIDQLATFDNFSTISDAETAPFNQWIEELRKSRNETNIQKAEELMSRYNNERKFKNKILNQLADYTMNTLKEVVKK